MNPDTSQAWGKTDESGTHHLAHHSADVAFVFRELLATPIFRRRAEAALGRVLTGGEIECLSALVFLHDIGKIAPVFQCKGWPQDHGLKPYGHLGCGYLWLYRECNNDIEHVLDGALLWMKDWAPGLVEWFRVIFAHHGKPVPKPDPTNRPDAFKEVKNYNWKAEEKQMGRAFKTWFPSVKDHKPPSPDNRFVHFICGLVALADWIGSDKKGFQFVSKFDIEYDKFSKQLARKRLEEIGLSTSICSLASSDIWQLIAPEHPQPRPVQFAVGNIAVDESLVILEAETGSGKTEAAILRFAKLFEAGEVDALYFAVPTRAAARQLHGRINSCVKRLLTTEPEAILAIPGIRVSGDAIGEALPNFETRWDDEKTKPSRWAAEHATRFLAAQIAVGTVDQAMRAGLQVKHAHLRGAALSRALLVIDEVHASDIYMMQIQCDLAKQHLDIGGHVMLMSATLGAAAREKWLGRSTSTDINEAIKKPYPAIWTKHQEIQVDKLPSQNKSVSIRTSNDWSGSSAAKIALEAATKGARVLVIRNTVDRARETWAAAMKQQPDLLMSVNGQATLHHSRFAAEDRLLLDREVESILGKTTPSRACVVIGTQTLEQSLDIDADYLVTDLCPIDVLLQRIGRLHRHNRTRPAGFENATTIVLCPADGLAQLTKKPENGLGSLTTSTSLSGVYMNVPSLQATMDQIAIHSEWHIPEMNRALVESATHPEALCQIAEKQGWEDYYGRLTGTALAQMKAADLVMLDRREALPEQFPDGEKIASRLGDGGVILPLPEGTDGPFGEKIQRMGLTAFWSHGLSGEEEFVVESGSPLRLTVGDKTFWYGADGLVKVNA